MPKIDFFFLGCSALFPMVIMVTGCPLPQIELGLRKEGGETSRSIDNTIQGLASHASKPNIDLFSLKTFDNYVAFLSSKKDL